MITYFNQNEILLIILAYVLLLGAVFHFVFSGKRESVIPISLLTLGCLIWNLLGIQNDSFLNLWDERFHALVARNLSKDFTLPQLYTEKLMLDFNYQDWPRATIWLHKQPFFMWLSALSIKFLGFSPFSYRLPHALLFSCMPLIGYRTGNLLAGPRAGFFTAILAGGSSWAFSLMTGRVNTDQNDLCFYVLISASIWALVECAANPRIRWALMVGVFAGLAVLTKWLMGLMIFGAWGILILLLFKERDYLSQRIQLRLMLVAILVAIVVFMPWQIYILIQFPIEAVQEYQHAHKHFGEIVENHSESFWYYFTENLPVIYGWFISILLALAFYKYTHTHTHTHTKN